MSGLLYRLSAFTRDPSGGNPAGVWIGDALPPAADMQRIATEVGFSETAFIAPAHGSHRQIRYFSPLAEVAFCGHATIAAGVQLGRVGGDGDYLLDTRSGPVPVSVRGDEAALTSVAPRHRPLDAGDRDTLLDVLGWPADALDPAIPPVLAYAGAWHAVLAVGARSTLDRLDYAMPALQAVSSRLGITTAQLVWRERADRFHARNPFPPGGVFEDPATGAAAAALGGYLRDAGLPAAPASFEIIQGEAMGRPSRLSVDVPASGGIVVRGSAVLL